MNDNAFHYHEIFTLGPGSTCCRLLTKDGVSTAMFEEVEIVKVEPDALTFLARQAMREVSFLLRPRRNEVVASILDDPEAPSATCKHLAQPRPAVWTHTLISSNRGAHRTS